MHATNLQAEGGQLEGPEISGPEAVEERLFTPLM